MRNKGDLDICGWCLTHTDTVIVICADSFQLSLRLIGHFLTC